MKPTTDVNWLDRAGSEAPGMSVDTSAPAAADARADTAAVASDVLLGGRRTMSIRHNGEIYRLQATRLGKLILTK